MHSKQTFCSRGICSRLSATLSVLGIVFTAQALMAQATYIYTGNPYTVASGSYTTSQRITATLQLNAWLPPGSACLDVTKLPGFRLVMSDGVVSLDSVMPASQTTAHLSTTASGNIGSNWSFEIFTPFTTTLVSQAVSSTSGWPCDGGTYSGSSDDSLSMDPFGYGESFNSPGVWTYPPPLLLVSMLSHQIALGMLPDIGKSLSDKLDQIAKDINSNSDQTCTDIRAFQNEIEAQSSKGTQPGKDGPPNKKIIATHSDFLLQTIAIIRSQLNCK
jgi:hypothetical protein